MWATRVMTLGVKSCSWAVTKFITEHAYDPGTIISVQMFLFCYLTFPSLLAHLIAEPVLQLILPDGKIKVSQLVDNLLIFLPVSATC